MGIGQASRQMSFADAGMAFALSGRTDLVASIRVRLQVIALSRDDRTATADDVDLALAEIHRTHRDLGNAAGAIFRDGRWRFTGVWQASTRDSNHGRPVRRWELKS